MKPLIGVSKTDPDVRLWRALVTASAVSVAPAGHG
jgi:hypothetical protein